MEGSKLPKAAPESKVYSEEDAEWVTQALKAGIPIGHIEYILLQAKLHDKKPADIQSMWMDAHVGVQQIWREL